MKLKIIIIILIIILTGCSPQPEITENAAANIPEPEMPEITSDEPETDNPEENNVEEENEISEEIEIIEEITEPESAMTDGFMFIYNGVNIYLGEYTERILEELGESLDYYEMDSCNFDGIARTYFYGGFEIETYMKTKNGKDLVYSIDLVDDSAETPEGVYIGQSYEDMTAAYGSEYNIIEEIPGFYSYNKNGTLLNFNIKDGVIISVTYKVADINA